MCFQLCLQPPSVFKRRGENEALTCIRVLLQATDAMISSGSWVGVCICVCVCVSCKMTDMCYCTQVWAWICMTSVMRISEVKLSAWEYNVNIRGIVCQAAAVLHCCLLLKPILEETTQHLDKSSHTHSVYHITHQGYGPYVKSIKMWRCLYSSLVKVFVWRAVVCGHSHVWMYAFLCVQPFMWAVAALATGF